MIQWKWLTTMGESHGWYRAPNAVVAQRLANEGYIVAAVWKNPNASRSGHIMMVQPSTRWTAKIQRDGPILMGAGRRLQSDATAVEAFGRSKLAKIGYFYHAYKSKSKKPDGKVSSRRVTVTVLDVNSILDDEYDLWVNDTFIGHVKHLTGGKTSFEVKLNSGRNTVELRLTKKRGKSTLLVISINGDEFAKRFSGSRDHRWTIVAP